MSVQSEESERQQQEQEEQYEQDDDVPGNARASVRFITGTVPWRENMYQTQGLRRRQHAGYKEYMRAYYEANKEKLNARRKEKRKEARDTFQKLIDEKKKVGRPPLPIEAMMVPKELARGALPVRRASLREWQGLRSPGLEGFPGQPPLF